MVATAATVAAAAAAAAAATVVVVAISTLKAGPFLDVDKVPGFRVLNAYKVTH